jgi:hypothetical protein
MVDRVKRIPACTIRGCPEPRNPEWHVPWCQAIPGHECFGNATHQHVPKRSQGGKKIWACLCAGVHDRIDNGDWGNTILDVPGVGRIYRVWDLHGNVLFERVIEGESTAAEEATQTERDVALEAFSASASSPTPSAAAPLPSRASSIAPAAALSHEQRVQIASEIRHQQRHRQWKAGDTANAWEAEMGESAWQYLDDFGYRPESLSNIMKVCEACPVSLRRVDSPHLSFSHYQVLYTKNREDIEMWLDKAEEEEWSVGRLRREVHGAKPRVRRWSIEELRELAIAWLETNDSEHVMEFLSSLEAQ